MRMMIAIVTTLCLVACGDDSGDDGDDQPAIDAPMGTPDMNTATPATCADYCAAIGTNCTAANEQFSSAADCMASCATWEQGTLGAQDGNSLECRSYHAGAAAGAPTVHCRHAGPGGDGACGTNCEGFCTLVSGAMGVCTGGNPPYADLAACTAACPGFNTDPPYSTAATTGNTFACRLYHATAASTNSGLHCPHTAVVSATCN
jgi:hypothetical protein